MKKFFLLAVTAIVLSATQSFAQSYKTGLGLGIEFGDGSTLVGPSYKHFFNGKDAVQADLLFGADAVWLGGYYQYHQPLKGTPLKWYLGVGPQLAFVDDNGFDNGSSTFVFLRPMVGLDFKVPSAPISMTLDWRPAWQLNNDSDFEAARFGLGFRYTF
ncbi:hypothetical protein LJ707_12380 [Mucilaginibacter sp. UR6-1]|uniref:hypothetical protein n=1 Tax=Mucilaginibacter sp. UR6-1 TaxID=1435643 RepID=UPI001E609EF8|nr:hypothetical protein [Mucilaginibacter sp. UR6-1]MCC8409727.1 hypothetical protein [Mucilaginibacter sp. UR6-1]